MYIFTRNAVSIIWIHGWNLYYKKQTFSLKTSDPSPWSVFVFLPPQVWPRTINRVQGKQTFLLLLFLNQIAVVTVFNRQKTDLIFLRFSYNGSFHTEVIYAILRIRMPGPMSSVKPCMVPNSWAINVVKVSNTYPNKPANKDAQSLFSLETAPPIFFIPNCQFPSAYPIIIWWTPWFWWEYLTM